MKALRTIHRCYRAYTSVPISPTYHVLLTSMFLS